MREPVLIDVPERLETARLVLRPPRRGDGAALNAAVLASAERLQSWMPWAMSLPSPDDSEAWCRRQHARYELREDLTLLVLTKGSAGADGELVGATGLHRLDWTLRTFETGYWLRDGCEGRGYMSEAVNAVVAMAEGVLAARRVEIRCDTRNVRSVALAERCGFALEGVLRQDSVTPAGEPRDTNIYARVTRAGDGRAEVKAP